MLEIYTYVKKAFNGSALWIALAIIFCVLEGAVRKWVPGFSGGVGRFLMYFSKDICLFIALCCVYHRKSCISKPCLNAQGLGRFAIFLIIIGGAISFFIGFSATGTLLSLRALVILPVLGYLYVVKVKKFPILGIALVAVLLAMVNAPLSLIQSGLPSGHVLNKYANDMSYVVEVESGVRATGTFAYISGLGVAAALGLWGGMVCLAAARNIKLQLVGILGIISSFACAFATGSRGGLVVLGATLMLWALSSVKASKTLWKSLWLAGIVGLAALIVLPSIAERFIVMFEGVLNRFSSAGDSNTHRAFGQWEELWYAVTHHPMGTGVGTEQVGANYISKGSSGFTQYESQFPRIVAEFGVFGFVGFLFLILATIMILHATRGGEKLWRWNLVVTATQITLLGQFYGNLVYNHTASAMIWLLVIVVIASAPKPLRKP